MLGTGESKKVAKRDYAIFSLFDKYLGIHFHFPARSGPCVTFRAVDLPTCEWAQKTGSFLEFETSNIMMQEGLSLVDELGHFTGHTKRPHQALLFRALMTCHRQERERGTDDHHYPMIIGLPLFTD